MNTTLSPRATALAMIAFGNDSFVSPGRRDEADAAMAGIDLGADAINDIPLILPQLGCAHCGTLRIGDSGNRSVPRAAVRRSRSATLVVP